MPEHEPIPQMPLARPAACRRLTLTLNDGYRTSVLAHDAKGAARGVVVCLHGIQSHPGWFVGSCAAMADAGFAVYQVTRRGSGDNVSAPGHARGAGQLLADVSAAVRWAREQSRFDRVHMVGVSWGGKLLAAWAAREGASETGDAVSTLTLVAPGIVPLVDIPAGTKLAVAASLFCCPRRLFDIPLNDPKLFTDNPVMLEYLRADTCSLRRATARFLYTSRQLDRMIGRAPRRAIAAPTTLILANRDRIIDNARTRAVVDRLTDARANVQTVDGSHTLEFEAEPGMYYRALINAIMGGA